jgi:integrase
MPEIRSGNQDSSRLLGRIEAVLDFAKARGWRSGENPAAWRGNLALILPKRQRLSRGHHAAMPYQNLPEFIGKLREHRSVSTAAIALEFAILTAARSGEVLGARWDDLAADKPGSTSRFPRAIRGARGCSRWMRLKVD